MTPRMRNLCPVLCLLMGVLACALAQTAQAQVIEWLTTVDRSSLLEQQPALLHFTAVHGTSQPTILVDDTQRMQTIDGFGFAMTGGSAQLLMKMSPAKRTALLKEIFGTGQDSIGVSYLRISIGSSDMNESVFTYDDLPAGETDPGLKHFSLGPDLDDVVPVMQQVVKINPSIRILASPWSAPSWMKTVQKPKAGSLKPEYYDSYAAYLVRYVRAMGMLGIRIDAVTPQNEPLNPHNTPSMVMTAEEEGSFLKQALGPAFRKEAIATRIILYDHNCDRPDYPLAILADNAAAQYADGSGFHLYGGNITAMTQVHDAHPGKNLYFTEQMVVDQASQGPGLHIAAPEQAIVIGALRNWSRNVLLWNLAADPRFGPHTGDGGCPMCEGAITLEGDTVTRNLAWYTLAQVAKFVRPGAVRVASTASGDAPQSVAFRTQKGKLVLLVANSSDTTKAFNIKFHGKVARASLPSGAVATYLW